MPDCREAWLNVFSGHQPWPLRPKRSACSSMPTRGWRCGGGVVRYRQTSLDSRTVRRPIGNPPSSLLLEAFEHLTAAHPQLEINFTRFPTAWKSRFHLGEESPRLPRQNRRIWPHKLAARVPSK